MDANRTSRRIAVAGATGRVGRHIVDVLRERGHDVVPIARATGVDVVTGDGLATALAGVDVVVDAATGPSPDQESATAFFSAAARNLQDAGARAGVRQLIAVSIIGVDRFTAGYSAAKLVHEEVTLGGPLPARVLRAAQFHEFVAQLVEWGTQGEVAYVQPGRTQLVAARSVAEVLADLALADGPVPEGAAAISEVAGPREESMVEAARLYVSRRGLSLKIEEADMSADPDRDVYVGGGLLPGPDASLVGPTYEEWLDAQS
jgi:uncharacterized protein YbjT (DUF2867 family)